MPEEPVKTPTAPAVIFPAGESWQIDLRGTAETVAGQIRGLLRVPESDKHGLANQIVVLWPEATAPASDEQKAHAAEASKLREQAAALLKQADELEPPKNGSSVTLVAVKIFCRVNKTAKRDKTEKRELHLNGSIVEI